MPIPLESERGQKVLAALDKEARTAPNTGTCGKVRRTPQVAAGITANEIPDGSAETQRTLGDGGGTPAGRWTVTVVPPAAGLDTVIDPRCASTSRFAVDSPRPVPRDLDVTNGVKSRSRISGGIPEP